MIEKIKIGNRNIVIRVKKMIVLGIQQFQDPYYQGVAAQLAFFMFLSILPTFILLSQVLGFFSLSLSSIENWVDINISGAGADTLRRMLNYHPSGINSVFLAFTAVWAASRVQFAMIRVTNYTLTDGGMTDGSMTDGGMADMSGADNGGDVTAPAADGAVTDAPVEG